MYFLPANTVKVSSVFSRLEKNLQLMSRCDLKLPGHWYPDNSVINYGSELILFQFYSGKIRCCKFQHEGITIYYKKYKCVTISIPKEIPWWRHSHIESIPVLAAYDPHMKVNADGKTQWKKFKICFVFFDISGNVSDQFCVKDVSFDIGCCYHQINLLTKSKYIVLLFYLYRKSTSLQPWWERKWKWSDESIIQSTLIVLFEIQLNIDNYYECAEISRINLGEYAEVETPPYIQKMICNNTEEKILFQFHTLEPLSQVF